MPQIVERTTQKRQRGGQPSNRNAWRHGNRSTAVLIQAKVSVARIKALAHVAHSSGLLIDDQRFRVRPLRDDQMALLWLYDRELAFLLGGDQVR